MTWKAAAGFAIFALIYGYLWLVQFGYRKRAEEYRAAKESEGEDRIRRVLRTPDLFTDREVLDARREAKLRGLDLDGLRR